jgi:hypothetical protein
MVIEADSLVERAGFSGIGSGNVFRCWKPRGMGVPPVRGSALVAMFILQTGGTPVLPEFPSPTPLPFPFMPEDTDSIDLALDSCLAHASADGILLREMLDRLGRSSFCFAALLLAVPFVQPFSLGPFTMMAAVATMIIGWQMGTGKEKPVLPQAAARLLIHGKGWVRVLQLCKRLLSFCRRFTRVRRSSWVSGAKGERFVGWLIFVGGALIAVPMANLPFNDTLPAFMVIFACIGWLEKDGLMVIVSIAWGIATLLYFTAVLVALWLFGSQVSTWIGKIPFFH